MNKINANKLIDMLLLKYKAKEITREEFCVLLTGRKSDCILSNSELMENSISDEIINLKYYLINDNDVINNNCKCIPESFGNIKNYMTYNIHPYILIALGLSQDNTSIEDYYIMSSFEHNIFEEIRKL